MQVSGQLHDPAAKRKKNLGTHRREWSQRSHNGKKKISAPVVNRTSVLRYVKSYYRIPYNDITTDGHKSLYNSPDTSKFPLVKFNRNVIGAGR
jgi:hypothetical protein